MSTSMSYYAFGIKGVKYISTKYVYGSVIFHAEVTNTIERCPACKSERTQRKNGTKIRELKMVPIGAKQIFLRLKI